MPSAVNHITFDCADPELLGRFWADALGLVSHADNATGDPEWYVYDPSGRVPNTLFIRVPEAKTVKNRVHLDLQPMLNGRDIEVEWLLTLGASVVADHRRPDGTGWVTMADPEGNEFCVERSASERLQGSHVAAPRPPERNFPEVRSANERTMLCGLLDWYREGVVSKLSGLEDPLRAQVSATRSNTTLNGLVKHLALVEDSWFSERMTGVEVEPWASAPFHDDPDWEFTSARTDDSSRRDRALPCGDRPQPSCRCRAQHGRRCRQPARIETTVHPSFRDRAPVGGDRASSWPSRHPARTRRRRDRRVTACTTSAGHAPVM